MTRTIQNSECISETFDSIAANWKHLQGQVENSTIFSTFEFSNLWWQHFGTIGSTLYLKSLWNNGRLIGIAPLRIENDTIKFIGSSNISDYLDFVVSKNDATVFFDRLFKQLKEDGLTRLELSPLRPDSPIIAYLNGAVNPDDFTINKEQEDVTFELQIPDSWDNYFLQLSSKQRHELRRKIRRVAELGDYSYVTKLTADEKNIDSFLQLFKKSRNDKQAFLTTSIERYFRELIYTASGNKWLELNFIRIGNTDIASTLCFNYKNTTYLYNSGYAPEYREFSIGLVSKALGIKTSIEQKRDTFDFLKGSEVYKRHLGGTEMPLFHLSIDLNL